jgi:serine protein kinase
MNRRNKTQDVLNELDQQSRREFEANRRILSFDEYLDLLIETPATQLRGSAQYLLDVMKEWDEGLFQQSDIQIIGHHGVRKEIQEKLETFAKQGLNNRLILLHGPNGSAKSSIAQALMSAMENYSHRNQGALYSFNWVFPVDRIQKGGLGLNAYSQPQKALVSYAKLPEEEILCRIPSELRDHPLQLIAADGRANFLKKLLGEESAENFWSKMPKILTQGELSHRNRMIFDALLTAYNGDLKRVFMHVQVERFYFSRRYRQGIATIEPQMHVDAHQQQLTMSRNLSQIPPILQGLNLFSMGGDLVDGNRGLVEFSDLLKRPVDSFKYLLTACETNSIQIGTSQAYLDTIFIGSTNELQLDAFKEFPDFNSFKARIDLIRVPYLLKVSDEQKIYEKDLDILRKEKHVAPHVGWTLAQWAVLTRLKKPNPIHYPPSLSSMISHLTPLEKSRLYDTGEIPVSLTAEERKLLRSHLDRIHTEYDSIPYYEGRLGASAREIRTILYGAARKATLTPLQVMSELEDFVKRVSEYEFLKQEIKDGYHDATDFIRVVREEYLNRVDREVRQCMGLYESTQWEDFIKKYVAQVSLVLRNEKTKNQITGKMEDPDFALVEEFEKIVDAPSDSGQKEGFRQNMITQVGAWSLDHPNEPVIYSKVFPEYWQRLERFYYESQKALLSKMRTALTLYDRPDAQATEEGSKLAQSTVANMVDKLGYNEVSARETIMFLMQSRY